MYILTDRLVEQIEFMEKQFSEEAEANQIKNQYGFFDKSAEDVILDIKAAILGGRINVPFVHVQEVDGNKELRLDNIKATVVGDGIWSNDRSVFDIATAMEVGKMKASPIDLTKFLTELFERFKETEATMDGTNPLTGEPLPKDPLVFEKFLRTIK